MTVVEQGALFDITAAGELIPLVADVPAPEAVEVVETTKADEWQAGLDYRLSRDERAMVNVGPDEVSVADYAGHMTLALTALSERNGARGYVKATRSPEHRPEIESRKGAHTDDIAGSLGYNSLTGERRARYEFFAASGLGYLALSTAKTPLSPDERIARRVMGDRYDAFERRYGGTGAVATARNKFKARLAKLAPAPDNRDE